MSWRDDAACWIAQADPTLFDDRLDPPENPTDRKARHLTALTYCDLCPVRSDCLKDALAAGDEGVRGGQVLEYDGMQHRRRTVAPLRTGPNRRLA